jgi:hypothetical protein
MEKGLLLTECAGGTGTAIEGSDAEEPGDRKKEDATQSDLPF